MGCKGCRKNQERMKALVEQAKMEGSKMYCVNLISKCCNEGANYFWMLQSKLAEQKVEVAYASHAWDADNTIVKKFSLPKDCEPMIAIEELGICIHAKEVMSPKVVSNIVNAIKGIKQEKEIVKK